MQKIKRFLFNELQEHLNSKEISLIVGPRQAGKTTLMMELKDFLDTEKERTTLLNLDYENDKKFFNSQEGLIKKLDLELGRKKDSFL